MRVHFSPYPHQNLLSLFLIVAILTGETFKELMPIFLKVLQRIERKGTIPNASYGASINLCPKPNKDARRRDAK
jgi:hypothetical protein